jgi:hypothetical protein
MTERDSDAARNALVTLRSRVDAHFDSAAQTAGEHMRCAVGCDQCCHVDLGVFEIEAHDVRAALAELDADTRAVVRRQAQQTTHCAMLVEGKCAVYERRPLICRSHGVAVLLEDGRVEHCPLNFTQAPPRPESVLRLEAINRPLSVIATMWNGDGARVLLRTLAAES